MKIAIMQPYLFPYLSYFKLINAVDVFGIAGDAQFINKGWINRNRILVNNKVYIFTFSVSKDSYNKKILERYFHDNFNFEKKKFIKTLELNYKKAPYYINTIEIIESIFDFKEKNVSVFVENSLRVLCNLLNIKVPFINSQSWKVELDNCYTSEERAVKKLSKLKKEIGITHFINSIGGTVLYNKDVFAKNGLKLSFLQGNEFKYKQFDGDFIPNLSIIDVLMFNSIDKIKASLNEYKLI